MDYKVTFSKNKSDNPSNWSIGEFPIVSGRKQKEFFLDLFPQHFFIKELTYHWGMTDKNSWFVDKYNETIHDTLKNPAEHEGWERLEGNLTSTAGASYSMFGADQVVKDIKLYIHPGEQFWGQLRASDNTIRLSVTLPHDEFNQIVEKVKSDFIKEGYLSFVANGGFYSEKSFMEYDPDIIKVLHRRFVEESLLFEDDQEKNSPYMNVIRNLDYSFSSRINPVKDSSVGGVNSLWVTEKVNSIIRSNVIYYQDNVTGSYEDQAFVYNEELQKKLKGSPKARLLKQMLFEAYSYCVEQNVTKERQEELSDEIINLVENMASAFQEDSWYEHKRNADALQEFYQRKWSLWKHANLNFRKFIGGEKRSFVDIIDLKRLAAEYLGLPIRSRMFSRILIDAMIYHETASYAETLLYASPLEKSMFGVEAKILLRGHPLWRFLKSHFKTFIILAALPIIGLWQVVETFEVREAWPLWVGLACIGLFTLNFTLGAISLPYTWISEAKEKKRVAKLLEGMAAIYSHLGDGEIISARFILRQLEKTANKGAVWPSEIFPLLDDIIKRDGII